MHDVSPTSPVIDYEHAMALAGRVDGHIRRVRFGARVQPHRLGHRHVTMCGHRYLRSIPVHQYDYPRRGDGHPDGMVYVCIVAGVLGPGAPPIGGIEESDLPGPRAGDEAGEDQPKRAIRSSGDHGHAAVGLGIRIDLDILKPRRRRSGLGGLADEQQ